MELTVGLETAFLHFILYSFFTLYTAILQLVHAAARPAHLQTDAVQRQAHILL